MSLEHLNDFLKSHYPLLKAPLYIFITGASGAGKSYVTQALEKNLDAQYVAVKYFDHIGVPDLKNMIQEYGSPEKWQEVMTHKWAEQLTKIQDKQVIILEGQFNPQFAVDACKEHGISRYLLILLHADKKVRDHRLIEHRAQPELANETMDHWAEFLKIKTQELGGVIIDTSDSDEQAHLNKITDVIKEALDKNGTVRDQMKIIIREAQDEDTEELETLFKVTRQQTFKSRSPDEFKIGDYKNSIEGEIVWVATKDSQIAGFISVYMPNFIHNLFVYRQFQNQGIGTLLLQKAEETLESPLELKIAMDNLEACPFYEKHGWKEVSVHREGKEPYLLYRKTK